MYACNGYLATYMFMYLSAVFCVFTQCTVHSMHECIKIGTVYEYMYVHTYICSRYLGM